MKSIAFVLSLIASTLPLSVQAEKICDATRGALVIAQDGNNTFLGIVSGKYDGKSIFNEYGDYGGKYSNNSIWNEYGQFGGKYGQYSPFNQYSSSPPMLIKNNNVIGYISVDKNMPNSINPSVLKAICDDQL